jgi:ABC-type lipoprotein release transport system permease subunit
VAAVPAWRSTRITTSNTTPPGSTIATRLAALGVPTPASVGVRFALEPGRGRAAVPTRATIVGAVTGITVAVASLTFAASLSKAVNDSQFYGVNFDGAIQYYYWGDDGRQPSVAALVDRLRADPGIADVAVLRAETVTINGQSVPSLGWVSTGAIAPTIAEGRAPRARGEVALGQLTLDSLGVNVGDRVDVQARGFAGSAFVVGRAVLPGITQLMGSDRTTMGSGAVMTDLALGPQDPTVTQLAFRVHRGEDVGAVYQRAETNRPANSMNAYRLVVQQPADVMGLRQLRDVPLWLAAALIIVVAATVVHALVIGVRRRRLDLAVLQVLGAERRTLRRIGLVQGVTVVLAASVMAIPLGIIAGRWSWTWLADLFGTIVVPVVPWSSILIMAVVMAALAGVAGMGAVRRSLRGPIVGVLRDE